MILGDLAWPNACPESRSPFTPLWSDAEKGRLGLVLHAVTLRNLAWQGKYQRTIVPTADGGTFGLDWFRCQEACESLPENAPMLLVLHSITGQSKMPYIMAHVHSS